ncbi:MAG: hypothetical protein ABJC12_09200 [Saprospiraceae bacterium]
MSETILVGDIGSTKSSWWLSGNKPVEIHLNGFNPLVHSSKAGIDMISSLADELNGIHPDKIWYYGAGLVSNVESNQVKTLFETKFRPGKINVKSDLAGAAIAACGSKAGTVIILGTGSHAAVFDGHEIIRQTNALGFILGDEGGGCDIGKCLLRAYYYDQMPLEVRTLMEKFLPGSRSEFLKALTSSSTPNQYLAKFAEVAVAMKDHPWLKNIVITRFDLFIRNHLLPLYPAGQVHVVGSIGCIFADLIENELVKNGLSAGEFIKDPGYRLFTMHVNHEIKE